MPLERLQKLLAQAGVASRRSAEAYILDGRVKVNGEVVRTLGSRADIETDHVEVQGHGRIRRSPHVYLILHKPIHVVTTVHDPEGRRTIIDVLEATRAEGPRQFEGELPRVFPVGRLDFDAEGLVLLTNDGDLAQLVLHPRYHVPKTYAVKVRGQPEERDLLRIRKGVRLRLDNGELTPRTRPADVQVIKHSPSNTWLEITITEGRHHQIKLMCDAIGHPVNRLIRTDFGGIPIGDLPSGAWRFLDTTEVARLRGWAGERLAPKTAAGGRKTAAGGRKTTTGERKVAAGGREVAAGGPKKAPGGRRTSGEPKKAPGGPKNTTGGRRTSGGPKNTTGGRRTTGNASSIGKMGRKSARGPKSRGSRR